MAEEWHVPGVYPESINGDTAEVSHRTWDQGFASGVSALTGGPVRYLMAGRDQACAPGSPPHTWVSTGGPDPNGNSAGALPCGGPLGPIWIEAILPPAS